MEKDQSKMKPLKVSCTATDCESNLHCFKFHQKKMTADQKGACRSCGVKLVDWKRVHNRNLEDVDYTFNSLKHELIRHHNWHREIDIRAVNHARRKGRKGMRTAAENRIMKYIAPANPYRDGQQTPLTGNVIFYAQHSTASCCRKCAEYWHDIPQGRDMTEAEIEYLTDLIMHYIDDRLPDLTEDGQYVAPIRKK